MSQTYKELVGAFKPQFGNANHIAAVPLIVKAKKLQERLDNWQHKQPPRALIKELTTIEDRVLGLLGRGAKLSTYPPSSPQDDV
jgi:hypothetical protein